MGQERQVPQRVARFARVALAPGQKKQVLSGYSPLASIELGRVQEAQFRAALAASGIVSGSKARGLDEAQKIWTRAPQVYK